MFTRILVNGCLAAVFLTVSSVNAQTLHKSIMPDGSVVYGDRPEPGAAKVETSKPDTSKTGVQINPQGARGAVEEGTKARQRTEGSGDRLRVAEERVRQAEAALANGKEPLPGERSGLAGGGSKLNDSYWERQKKLREDLVKARDELNKLRTSQLQ
jgi:hypothetical protein